MTGTVTGKIMPGCTMTLLNLNHDVLNFAWMYSVTSNGDVFDLYYACGPGCTVTVLNLNHDELNFAWM